MARASNGESSIHVDTAGRWHGYVSMGLRDDGGPDRRHVTGKTRATVAKKVRELEKGRDSGSSPHVGKPPTLSEWLDHWLPNIAARRVRPRTLSSYQAAVDLHIKPGLGHHRLDRLQPEHLERFYVAMSAKGLAGGTILRTHRIVSRALKVAMQRGQVARNVATLVDAPTVRRAETPDPLDLDECRRVLQAAAGTRNAARWTVALALGLRQSEALGLRWSDVDLGRGTLSVRRGLHRVSGRGLVFEEPKADRSRRTIALPAELTQALREHKVAQQAERDHAKEFWEDHELVFAQPNGRPLDKKGDYNDWIKLLKRAEVRRVRLHDGRHTAATLLLSEGVHPRVVMELLGHAQMRTTTDIYSHVMPALAQEAAQRMSAALWGPEREELQPKVQPE
jgi:integrase